MISTGERARQFMPFDALDGFYNEIRKKEKRYDQRIELSESQKEEISDTLKNLMKNDIIKIKYYSDRVYKTEFKKVDKLDTEMRCIITTDKIKIPFINILSIELI